MSFLDNIPKWQKITAGVLFFLGLFGTAMFWGVRTYDDIFIDRPALMSQILSKVDSARVVQGEINANLLYLFQLRCYDLGLNVLDREECPIGRPEAPE